MGETQGMTHLESKFLTSCEPVKLVMCFQNKMVGQAEDRHSHSRKEKQERKKGDKSQTSLKPSKINFIRF